MKREDILNRLRGLGSEKGRELRIRHGGCENCFGAKLADVRALAKEIRPNPELAKELWETGNDDARMLAILLMRPKKLAVEELERLLRDQSFPQLLDWLISYVVKVSPHGGERRERWLDDADPAVARAGWSLTADLVAKGAPSLDLPRLLARLESEMPNAHPLPQWTMNTCLAMVGIHHPAYRAHAMELGERLSIYRDYPTPKGCTSPFAPIWITEMVRRATYGRTSPS